MRSWKAVLLVCFMARFACASPAGAADSFSIAQPASWVDVKKSVSGRNPATNSPDEGVRIVLLDDQVNVLQSEHYHRVIKDVVNANGVQDCVQLNFDYEPGYQQLVIHDVFIRRGTNILNRLQPEKIKVIQQERDLDMNLYNGDVSAVLFLEDVRMGDQIEYSYTIRGSNPILAGHYVDDFQLQWQQPVECERFRLLWPTNRFLGMKNHGTNTQPVIKRNGQTMEYLWELHDVPAIVEEDSLPSWYNPYPWVQFSEFGSWKEVGEWAARLYPRLEHLDPGLREKISEWQRLHQEPEAQMASVLEFVQGEIRYMGIEVGPNSHQPNDPSLVFARRFGDCKDKAYLFCTILQAMNINAVEALVHTENCDTIADWLPSPFAFNHVVARVQLDGRTYWLDPTESQQGGLINNRYFPDYGCCLLVRPGTEGLTVVPQQRTGWPRTVVRETFVVHGRKEPADFTVRTRTEGLGADRLRQTLAEKRRDELEKDYVNYYAREYPKIKVTQPLEILDHREQNILETIEHYQIQEFWTLSDDKQKYECEFYPQTIRDLLDEPATTLRSMPLAISYPCHDLLQTEVILPEAWPVKNKVEHIRGAAAQLDAKREVKENTFRIEYEYQTLTNLVPSDEMPAYVKHLNQMKDELGYSLTWANEDAPATDESDKSRINWGITALAAIYSILLLVGAVALHRFRPRQFSTGLTQEPNAQPSGLGGWLILPALGLFVSPIRVSFTLAGTLSVYAPESWHSLTDPSGAAYNSLWAPVLIYELLVNLTLPILAILLLVLFFQRRRTFPVMFILFIAFAAITATIDHYLAHLISATAAHDGGNIDRTLAQNYAACLIWIPYMLVSKRVKATFVR